MQTGQGRLLNGCGVRTLDTKGLVWRESGNQEAC